MAWEFVGVSSVVEVTATSHTLTLPTGTQPGDLLVAVISSRIASTTSITLPSGWTLVAESKTNNVVAAATTSEASGMMAYIVRGASTPALGFTHPTAPSVARGQIVAYRGQAASPFDVGIGAKTGTNITAISTTGLTTGLANELIVKGVCSGRAATMTAHDAATDPTTSSGTGSVQTAAPIVGTWQERSDASSTTGADTGLAIADAIRGTAGATGALTATASVAGGHAQVAGAFRIQPFGVNSSATAGTTINTTIPATVSGDCIVVAGQCAGPSPTITAGGQSVTWGKLGGLTSPRQSPHGRYLFVGIITGPSVGTTTVTLTCSGSAFNELGAWVVPGLTSPVQDKGINALYSIDAGTVKGGLTGALTNSSSFAASYYRCNSGTTTSIDRTAASSGAWHGDSINTANFGSGYAHQHKTDTNEVQASWNNSDWGGDVITTVYRSTPPSAPSDPTITCVDFSGGGGGPGTSQSTSSLPFKNASQSGDVIFFAIDFNDTSVSGLSIQTDKGDTAYTLAQLGGVTTPVFSSDKGLIVGYFANPTVGTTYITVSTTASTYKGVGAWLVRGMSGSVAQDQGVWRNFSADDAQSGLTSTLATANEFALGMCSMPHASISQTTPTGSGGFLYDSAVPSTDGAFGHQVTEATTAIQASFFSNNGNCALATFRIPTAAVTGTLATTEAADTASMAGSVAWTAPLATTEAADTASFAGTVRWTAPLATTEAPDTASFAGTVQWLAALSVSEGADTAAFNVTSEWLATLATTEAPDVAALSGSVSWAAILAATDPPDTATGGGGGGTATIEQVGSVVNVTGDSSDAGTSGSFTVPADTEMIVVTTYFFSTGGATDRVYNGTLKTQKGGTDTNMIGVSDQADSSWSTTMWYLTNPDIGSGKTLKWDWQGTSSIDRTNCFSILFFKGVDTTSPARDGDGISATGSLPLTTPTLTAQTGDLIVSFYGGFNGGSEGSVTGWTNATSLVDAPLINAGDGSWATSSPTGNQTVSVSSLSNISNSFGGLVYLVLKPATTGGGGAGWTGTVEWITTLAASEAADAAIFNGSVVAEPATGTLATTETPDVALISATVRWEAVLAASEAADVAAFAATVEWPATLATTEAPDTASFLGSVAWAALLAASEAPDVAAFTGTVESPPAGTMTVIEPADGAQFNVTSTWLATLATTEAADTASFNGTIFDPVTATLAVTEAPDTAAFSVISSWQVTLAASEAADTASFTGTVAWLATLSASEAPDVAAFNATSVHLAVLNTTEAADSASFAGNVAWAAVLAASEAPDTALFNGQVFLTSTGILAASEAPDIAAFTVTSAWITTLAASEPPDTAAFAGTVFLKPFTQGCVIT